MDFTQQLRERTAAIEEVLKSYLPKETGLQKTVLQAMNYSVLAGGKRLRPMLMQETYYLFGGKGTLVQPFMAALEMIHTYSLVHDDLPAMDNDEYRRGKKTTHAVYGEAMGILAGDGLLNYAFEIAADALAAHCDSKTARALQVLAQKAGIFGMIGGQVVDIASEDKTIDLDTLTFIHQKKCGALIEAAMLIGAILAGANPQEQEQIASVAADVGLAFQIQDDILDVTSNTDTLGKPVGSDAKNSKATYVSIQGLEQARQEVARLSNRALDTLAALPYENPFLEQLIHSLIHREK